MRDFNFKDDTIVVGQTPLNETSLNELPQTSRMEETILRDNSETMRPFHVAVEEEPSSNTVKMVGGVIVGLLIVGGGIYAYETFSPAKSHPQIVAMKAPTPNPVAMAQPANPPAVAPPATAPDVTAAPSQTAQDGISTTPSRTARSSNGTAAPPAATADDAVNTPMTLTPDNAPPPQQSALAGDSAMQQPITAPSVTAQMPQPLPEVANNADGAAAMPDQPQQTAPAADQPDQQQPATPAQ